MLRHNPHSAEYLVGQLKKHYPNNVIHAVVAMLHDKDIKSTLDVLSSVVDYWYPSSLKGPRAAQEAELCQYLSAVKGHYQTPVEALNQLKVKHKKMMYCLWWDLFIL